LLVLFSGTRSNHGCARARLRAVRCKTGGGVMRWWEHFGSLAAGLRDGGSRRGLAGAGGWRAGSRQARVRALGRLLATANATLTDCHDRRRRRRRVARRSACMISFPNCP